MLRPQQTIGRRLAHSVATVLRPSRGVEPAHLRQGTRIEQHDVPPRWEGLDAGEELRPDQKPEWRGKASSDEMFREEIGRRAHHEGIPLSHYRMRER